MGNCMDSRSSRGATAKKVKELGHIVIALGDKIPYIKPNEIDLPLPHFKTLGDMMAYAGKYAAILSVLKRNKRLFVAPFGVYSSLDDMLKSASYKSYMQAFASSARLPQSEAERIAMLDYL